MSRIAWRGPGPVFLDLDTGMILYVAPGVRKLALTSHVTFGWLARCRGRILGGRDHGTDQRRSRARAGDVSVDAGHGVVRDRAVCDWGAREWARPVARLRVGLFRHYWIVAKLGLTVLGTTILLLHAPRVSEMAALAAESAMATADHRQQRIALIVHAVGGLGLLLTVTSLSVFKPWKNSLRERGARAGRRYLVIGIGGVLALLVILHLAGVVGAGGH